MPTMTSCVSKLLLFISAVATAIAVDLPKAEEFNANWPRFRGPDGNGVCLVGDAPTKFDITSGENIAWSVEVPAAGFGSPVVWGNHVFLSGGDSAKCEVMCFDLASGKLQWKSTVPNAETASGAKAEAPDQSGMASSTVATDGIHVYAMFANGDLAALNFDGTIVWLKHLGIPKNPYGHATSLLTWQDQVILQFDQGEADEKLSKLYAFDGATGAIVWEQPRSAGASWATPIVIEATGKSQLITLASPFLIAYSVKDGSEIWRADCLDGEVTPSPVFAGDTLFVIHPTSKLQAIRVDGQGDVTKTHIRWIAEDGIPDITSPVSNGELVFLVDSSGMATCYDAKTGKKQWEHDFEEPCNASPSIVGNKLYLITKKGTLIVADSAREFKELARSTLGEEVLASPAFAQNKMFVRSLKHLLCLGGK